MTPSCSLHFVGGNGPTKEDPDPVSVVASKEGVSLSIYDYIVNNRHDQAHPSQASIRRILPSCIVTEIAPDKIMGFILVFCWLLVFEES